MTVPVIDARFAELITGPVSILVATSTPANAPTLGVGLGVRLAADRLSLAVFVLDTVGRPVIRDVQGGRPIAITFTHSRSARSVQLKAPGARVEPLADGDVARMDAYADALAREWAGQGQPALFAHQFLVRAPGEVVAIALAPTAAFDQTPGAAR